MTVRFLINTTRKISIKHMIGIRKKIFIGIGIVVGIVLAIILGYLFISSISNRKVEEIPNNVEGIQEVEVDTDLSKFEEPAPPVQRTANEFAVRQLSKDFTERFATHSNQNDDSHIEDVLPLATASMQSYIKTQKFDNNEEYNGITTKVIAIEIIELSESNATVSVDTQQEIETLKNSTISYRSGKLELINNGKTWKVDGFFWE